MLEIKRTIIKKMNNTFNGLISRLDIAKERISKLKDMSIEIPKLKWKEKKHNFKKQHRISKICGTITKGVTGISEGEEWDQREETMNNEKLKLKTQYHLYYH